MRAIAMNYLDTDTTQTDWSNFRQQNKMECRPITGVSTALGYMPAEYSGATLVGSDTELGGQSKSKLRAMFDKFLYQK
jgi:hypothetical protein